MNEQESLPMPDPQDLASPVPQEGEPEGTERDSGPKVCIGCCMACVWCQD